MSYSRSFRKRLTVPYSGTTMVSYPASQHGGTKMVSYSGTTEETVEVEVFVDTTPFDASVEDCSGHVDALTGSVVATEAAQVASIKENAKKVGDSIVDGFFNTVRFEISAQIVELQKRVDALLMDIHEKQKKLLELKSQMEKDYHRTAGRYSDIFGELNKELENRVHALDMPVFDSMGRIIEAGNRYLSSDLINMVVVAGKENAVLDAQISAALAKSHACKALNEANVFLSKKARTDAAIAHSTIDENKEQHFFAPVCCMEANDERRVCQRQYIASEILPQNVTEQVSKTGNPKLFEEPSQSEQTIIDTFFNGLVNNEQNSEQTDEHKQRVCETIINLYSQNH